MKITYRKLRKIIREAYDASYEVDKYLPGLKKAIAPLKGYAQEIKNANWGKDTELIRREMEDAMSSLNLVVAALEEASIEYERGPFGGELKPRSERIDSTTGEYVTKPSYAINESWGPLDDHLESISSQDMADAKRYAKSDLPRDQADYLDISVEDWYRIRQELDDHYEARHMEDQMAFDDDPDTDNDGSVDSNELRSMIDKIRDDL
jgi:hypothetical protein